MTEWLAQNWDAIVGVALAIYAVAKVIVNLTPTDKDNHILTIIVDWVEKALDFLIPNLNKLGGVHGKNLFIKNEKK